MMNQIINVILFLICLINWSNGFSQNRQTKLDSLKQLDQQHKDSIKNQLFKIDSLNNSLKKEQTMLELNKSKIDSLNKDNVRLKEMMNYTITLIDVNIIDSVDEKHVKSGYYYRILPLQNGIDSFNNIIDWIYISDSMDVQLFESANYEYCLLEMYFKKEPKQIYHQIKKDYKKFIDLYLKCTDHEMYIPSKSYSYGKIVLNQQHDVILFVKDGIIRKIRNSNDEILTYNYKFIGK